MPTLAVAPGAAERFEVAAAAADNLHLALDERYRAVVDARFAADPGRDGFDPECEFCAGTGTYLTTANDDGRWDYWRLGVAEVDDLGDGTAGGSALSSHSCRALALPSDAVDTLDAIVTPDGEWRTCGGEDDDAREILADWPEATAVLVDCHS